MADVNWDTCVAFVFAEEGGYTDDPLDPGGATNLGITLSALSLWRHSAVTKQDVKNLEKPEASAIYRTNYWNASRCADLPDGVDLMVFDAAVNTGNGRSAKLLQAAVKVNVDGSIGPKTLTAIRSENAITLIKGLAEARLTFYQDLPTYNHFGAGWTGRVKRAEAHALQMATRTAAVVVAALEPPPTHQ